MDSDLWERVSSVLPDALELRPAQQREFLDRKCQNDPALRAEVDSLIAASANRLVLDEPPIETATILEFSQPAPASGWRGRTVGHYRILEQIGEGGMGAVYQAIDTKLDRQVALKVLPLDSDRDEFKQRFAREAKAASALNHPNIVTIYEFGSDGERDFIAMEYVAGSTLEAVMADGAEPPQRLLEFVRQVAGGLAKAHAAGIVHRDLKPANIMITPDGVAKILDFGLASLIRPERDQDPDATVRQELTHAGTRMGTPPYMSPEQAMGERTDWRTDIFSFGTLLYEIVCGRRPFGGTSMHLTLHQVAMEDPAPVSTVKGETPQAVSPAD